MQLITFNGRDYVDLRDLKAALIALGHKELAESMVPVGTKTRIA